MKKVMLLAAMLAMVMVAAAPALAQSAAVGGGVQTQNQYSPQAIDQSATATQSNTGGGTGAAVSQNLGIDQSAANVSAQAGDDIGVSGSGGSGGGYYDDDDNGVAATGNGATAVGGDVQLQSQFCPQVIDQAANADQSNTGGGIGAGIAQNLGISQEAVNACLQAGGDINLGGGDNGGDDNGDVKDDNGNVSHDDGNVSHDNGDSGTVASTSGGTSSGAASSGSAPSGAASSGGAPSGDSGSSGGVASAVLGSLPDTGGFSLIALGAGILLVGGGLVARKMFR